MELLKYSIQLVTEVRNLTINGDVGLKIVTASWVRRNWGGKISEQEKERIKNQEEVYKLLGIVPWSYDLLSVISSQRGSAMAAAVGHDIYIVKEYFNPKNRMYCIEILTHELTHIIQKDNFEPYFPNWFDETQAWNSLIEGDALYTAELCVLKIGGEKPFRVKLGFDENYTDPLRMIWLFPYAYGDDYVQYIYERGGWKLVNECYSRVPESSMEILHPELYLEGVKPISVEAYLPSNYSVVSNDRAGEFFLNIFVGVYTNTSAAEKAAEGWRGDNLTLLRGDEDLLTWNITWSSENELNEFINILIDGFKSKGGVQVKHNLWRLNDTYIGIYSHDLSCVLMCSTDLDVLLGNAPLVKN